MSDFCPGCARQVHHWHPSPEYYPGKTYTYICGETRKDGDGWVVCGEKITVVIQK